jgi:tRNA(fMet)-specific endonuclease VapC
MPRFLFDTDHVTYFGHGLLPVVRRYLMAPPLAAGVSAVTVEESLRGRLAPLSRQLPSSLRVRAYADLIDTIHLLWNHFDIIPFDSASESEFQRLRGLRLRVGTRDLQIAAVALAHKMTLVTGNRGDFVRVPGLTIDDWTV